LQQATCNASSHLEIPSPLPIRDDRIKLLLFGAEEVEVVVDHVFAERCAGPRALAQGMDGFVERLRHLREVARAVDVALERRRRLDAIFDAVQSGGDGGGE